MTNQLKNVLPHVAVFFLFVLAATLYFSPVLQGKKIFQSDIIQYIGMASERDAYKDQTGEESYWTNSAFGGMPTYQLGANYPHNYIKDLDRLIRFLPRPADYLFLYFAGIYLLLLVLRVDWKLAAIGSLAFGFSTYLIIILGVGHNAKAHAIGYFAFVLAGIILAFRKHYIWGFLLTALAMALEINANHFQMTYYLLLLVVVLGVVYLVDAIKKKELPHYFKTVGLLTVAVVLSLVTNATNLMATREYAAWSTRGPGELTVNPDGSTKEISSGLDKDYITQYSYGLAESLNLIVPRLFGGADRENLGSDSETYRFLTNQGVSPVQASEFARNLPLYWGDQPGVAAPAYVGITVFFLFLLGAFLVKGRLKWWLLIGAFMSLVLSWGKNFGLLTDFMIDYFPLYDKFRAITSVQTILELCVPVLAMLGVSQFISQKYGESEKWNSLKYAFIGIGVVLTALFVFSGAFSFVGPYDDYYAQSFGQELIEVIKADRKAVYTSDLLRSFGLLAITALVLWFFLKKGMKPLYLVFALGLLILTDLVPVDRRYVNNEDFVNARRINKPFQAGYPEQEIKKDTALHFRVFNPAEGLNGAATSYFHRSIGGYHAAKPRRMQNLYEFHIAKNNVSVLNMLNVRYIIQQNEKGQSYPARNPYANGNAWFVNRLIPVDTPDAEIQALDTLETKSAAVYDMNQQGLPEELSDRYQKDSLARISLVSYAPDKLVYESVNSNKGLAVFSEMYYPFGWKVAIDGQEVQSFRVNYALRALEIPAGAHTISFTFEPEVVQTGSTISLAGNVLLALLFLGGLVYSLNRKRSRTDESAE
ncbi:YfhO family protein [Robertkochia aurantiaca]|uniref:YfhO family protein n=1 Tax=Robertkochia aurantiaca TaxID=2873700 RepID=UPI001CCB072C|nr:YfhO family protein [Robertkochia sp. 3YJGBD-33]